MAQYSKRTCNMCGIKDIQPNMYRTQKSTKTGSSNNSVTAGNLLWAAAGNKAALKKTKRSIVANNRRTYTRRSIVWMCGDCSGENESARVRVEKSAKKIERKERNTEYTGGFKKLCTTLFRGLAWSWLVLLVASLIHSASVGTITPEVIVPAIVCLILPCLFLYKVPKNTQTT